MAKRAFKVKKQLTVQKTYRKWEDYSVGDIVVGTVVGTHTDQYGKECPILKVEEAFFTDKKEQKRVTGANLVLNANGMLSKAIKENGIADGDMIQVEYKGTAVIQKGPYKGKDAHVVGVDLVEVDNGDEEELVDEEEDADL
jgi:hypothetical protein